MSLKVKLKKSLIGSNKKQIAIAQSLGLKRPGDLKDQPDNDATKGKVKKISHLVEIVK